MRLLTSVALELKRTSFKDKFEQDDECNGFGGMLLRTDKLHERYKGDDDNDSYQFDGRSAEREENMWLSVAYDLKAKGITVTPELEEKYWKGELNV